MSEKRILFVDDDITSLDIMAILFEKKGYEVIRSASAQHAIDSLDTDTPDVVVMDLMMPEINGVTAVRRMREKGLRKPILAFTASNDPALHDEAMDAGCQTVLTKPCKASTLVESVESYFIKK